MSYFNHAFHKTFLGTKGNQVETTPGTAGGKAGLDEGFITTADIPTVEFARKGVKSKYDLGPGVFGFVDESYKTVALEDGEWEGGCCPLYLVSASIKPNDKMGDFHGGYQESNKSKKINPKLISKMYRVDPSEGNQQTFHIGNTYFTSQEEDVVGCVREFMCDETYTLRIRISGEPAVNFMNHDIHKDVDAYTGCCDDPDGVPNAVDSTIVYTQWAKQIMEDPYLNKFVKVIVQDESDNLWFQTAEDAVEAGWADTFVIEKYVAQVPQTGKAAGMIVKGAFIETTFGDCTFDRHDGYTYKPVKFSAQLVDFNGDPCEFEGLCTIEECPGMIPMGLGETVVREVILHEMYLQNYPSGDERINEIMGGRKDPLSVVDRDKLYYRYYIQHNIPRLHNATSTFDNDQYLLCIVTENPSASLEAFLEKWVGACGDGCAKLEIHTTGTCDAMEVPAEAEGE